MSISNAAGGPLTARSIVASTLLGTHPPRLPVALLVRSCELFGIRENAARVALSRMVSAGELVVNDGWYSLVGHLRQRQQRQDQSRRGLPSSTRWDGTWVMTIVGSHARSAAERAELRKMLRHHRFGEWREGVWLRPDNLSSIEETKSTFQACISVPGAQPPAAKDLARELFDLGEWMDGANGLLKVLDPLAHQLAAGDETALTTGFVTNAAILRHLQADPLLPSQLLPKGWPGTRLRQRYERFDAVFIELWRRNLRL